MKLAPYRLMPEDEPAEAQTMTVQSPLSLGLFAGKWCSYSATPDLPHDQREEDGGALVFDTAPLTETMELLGAPLLELACAANRPIAMVAVRLSDVAPDDRATRISYGLLNLTHRNGHELPEPLEPGTPYRVSVQLNDIAQSLPPRHRLRLAISTSYWPLAWAPPASTRLAIDTGKSTLTLPVRPPRQADESLQPFGPPETAPPLNVEQLKPTEHNWRVIRDLARDRSTLEVIKNEGVARLEDTGTEVENRTNEWYTCVGGDFESFRGETQCVRGLKRDDWNVRTITRTVLTCTSTHFHLRAELDAYEADKRVFSQNWDRKIPRDHI